MSQTPKIMEVAPSPPSYLGEGTHWNSKKGELLYVDILGGLVHRYIPRTQEFYSVSLCDRDPEGQQPPFVSLVVPVEGEEESYIVTRDRSVCVMKWNGVSKEPSSLKSLVTVDDHAPSNRINDGKCDRHGRLWFGKNHPRNHRGTMGLDGVQLTPGVLQSGLYSLDTEGALRKHRDNLDLSNGLCWTKDQSTFYHIDSCTFKIDAFDYDPSSGTICNKRTAFDLKANNVAGTPDGMTIDANGNLWVACFGNNVMQVDPVTSKVIQTVNFPTKNVTCVSFGGEDLGDLYVTSCNFNLTKEERSLQPCAGKLFVVTGLGVKGLAPANTYKGPV